MFYHKFIFLHSYWFPITVVIRGVAQTIPTPTCVTFYIMSVCLYVGILYKTDHLKSYLYMSSSLSLSLSPYLLILPIYGHYRLVTILYPKLISFVLNFSMFICKLCTIDTYLYVQNDMLVKRFNKLLVHVLSSKTHYKICLDIKVLLCS